jgi:hypothetical protein
MVSVNQLAEAISELAQKRTSVYEFERWLRRESRDMLAIGHGDSVDAVFEIESALSDYHFEGVSEEVLVKLLRDAIRPFVPEVVVVYDPTLQPSHWHLRSLVQNERFETVGDGVASVEISTGSVYANVPKKPTGSEGTSTGLLIPLSVRA